jgi:TonB family protein
MVVQLVPAVAALGSPRGAVTAPPEVTPRPEPVAPKPEPAPAKAPPPVVKAPSLPERPTPPRVVAPAPPPLAAAVLPARERPRETFTPSEPTPRPDRTHAAALPRFDQRETPVLPVATATPTSNPLPAPIVAKAAPPTAASGAPPRALGRADGSPRGAGLVTVDGDFPWAWYIAAIQRKISEQWQEKALPGPQPTIVFEIGRDGQLLPGQLAVEKSSGNTRYDRTALAAIEAARPFPPLPADFQHALLRINVSFAYLRE